MPRDPWPTTLAAISHLRIRRAHLVGHSMGAVVAANVAVRYPARVASAALVAPCRETVRGTLAASGRVPRSGYTSSRSE